MQYWIIEDKTFYAINIGANMVISSQKFFKEARYRYVVPIFLIQWFELQATRAKYEGRTHDEAWHLLKAGDWNESHQILLRNVAPDAIINGMINFLNNFLKVYLW